MSENKNKFTQWLKARRYYIVLALCILTVSVTYLLLQFAPTIQKDAPPSDVTHYSASQQDEPLPDLADYFPPELEPDTIEKNRRETSEDADTQSNTSLPASAVATEIEEEYMVYQFPVDGQLQKPYSGNTLVFSETMSDWRIHSGVDFSAEPGSDVVACAAGIVEEVYTDERHGITIVLDHKNGVKSIYANLANGMLVEKGQNISAGEIISAVGNSALYEAAQESHLHFEMLRNGEHIDPLTMLE